MTREAFIEKLTHAFPDALCQHIKINMRELYLEVDPEMIREISLYINQQMGFPLLALFANDERSFSEQFGIYYLFGDRNQGFLYVIKTLIDADTPEFYSISAKIPGASLYEREIMDMFGLVPKEHPDLRRLVFHGNWPGQLHPLRKDFKIGYRPGFAHQEDVFHQVRGAGIYEIPVGPVHAGIIEPGHFRFSVAGELVIHLEAQLYYVHKGIEKLCEGESIEKCLFFSERISGDETFANSFAYCQAVEKIAGVEIPIRAEYTRLVFAELERLTGHLGDLAGICLDVAYGFAAYQFRMMRGWAYQIADLLCGMRFLRSVNKPGGVRKDFIAGKEKQVMEKLREIKKELHDTSAIIKANNLFIDRVENTGVLKHEIALDLNAVGPGGRASGVCCDARKSFPYAVYGRLEFPVPEHHNGDVNCRMNTKLEECFASIDLMIAAVEGMPGGNLIEPVRELEPYHFAFGITEAPRGENIHWVMSGENNTIFRYKVRTPSFCNWPALCYAVKDNTVPDFPLINKSFNLSYAGNDL